MNTEPTKYHCLVLDDIMQIIALVKKNPRYSDKRIVEKLANASLGVITEEEFNNISYAYELDSYIFIPNTKHKYSCSEDSECPRCRMPGGRHKLHSRDRSFSSSDYDCPSNHIEAKTSLCENCKKPSYTRRHHHHARKLKWDCRYVACLKI